MTLEELMEQLGELGVTGKVLEEALIDSDRTEAWLEAAKRMGARLNNPAAFVAKGIRGKEWPMKVGARPAAWGNEDESGGKGRTYEGMIDAMTAMVMNTGHEFYFDYQRDNVREELRGKEPVFLEKELRAELNRYERKYGFGIKAEDLATLIATCKERAKPQVEYQRDRDKLAEEQGRKWKLEMQRGRTPNLLKDMDE